MMKCIIEECNCFAKDRDYFFENEPLCDIHYIGYLEYLVQSFNVAISDFRADDSFTKYKIELKPVPVQKKLSSEVKSSSFKIKM